MPDQNDPIADAIGGPDARLLRERMLDMVLPNGVMSANQVDLLIPEAEKLALYVALGKVGARFRRDA